MSLRGLDDYIMGTHIHFEDDKVKHVCPCCGKTTFVPMFYELGGWFYQNDDDVYCPDCEQEMLIIEAE
jgi:Zn finger protein HypA/HybF involved in hydrogenase expression